MSVMTREDVLRELELLPVWQLKVPLPSAQNLPTLNPVNANMIEAVQGLSPKIEPKIEPAPLDSLPVEATAVVAPCVPFRLLICNDTGVGFVLDSVLDDTQDVETLLSNMLKAINMSCAIDMPAATLDALSEYSLKLVVVMGDAVAHSLMGQAQAIDDWRRVQSVNPVYYQHLPVVITYHPAFLLKNTAYKAKAWADLCTAKRILQAL